MTNIVRFIENLPAAKMIGANRSDMAARLISIVLQGVDDPVKIDDGSRLHYAAALFLP